jgi:hypothetical protein
MTGIPTRPNKGGWVHPLIKEVAIAFAETLYERLATNNVWYEMNKDRKGYVRRVWPTLLPAVRTHLATLCGPSSPISELEKQQICDALIKDHSLRLGRHRARVAKLERMFH